MTPPCSEKVRALIAVALDGNARIISTDSPSLAWDVGEIGADLRDLGFVPETDSPGLYLFQGERHRFVTGLEENEGVEYRGTLYKYLYFCDELEKLLALQPPESEEE